MRAVTAAAGGMHGADRDRDAGRGPVMLEVQCTAGVSLRRSDRAETRRRTTAAQRSLAAVVLLTLLVAVSAIAGPQGESSSDGTSVTTTNSFATTTSAPSAHGPACPEAGAPCGSCGPVGQCLEHVDSAPPRRVCVNGGFCVQLECFADDQCPRGQVCATLGGLSACRVPCP